MNDYNNYNGYQQESQPASPIVISPEGTPNYQQPVYQEPVVNSVTKFNAYGLISILLAPLGCCCCGLPTVIGLIVGAVGLGKYKKNILCIVGVVLSVLVLAYIGYSVYYTMQHPEEYQELMDAYMEMLQEMEQMEQMQQTGGFFRK